MTGTKRRPSDGISEMQIRIMAQSLETKTTVATMKSGFQRMSEVEKTRAFPRSLLCGQIDRPQTTMKTQRVSKSFPDRADCTGRLSSYLG